MKKILQRLAVAVVTMAACLGVMGMTSASALASPPLADGCSGGKFCGWDGRDFTGDMVVTYGSWCSSHDIGLAGRGDRLTSYWNSTGKTVDLYNWTGTRWQLLASIRNDQRGNLPAWANNQTDAVAVCTSP
jgi:peptidase inhibitor family I36